MPYNMFGDLRKREVVQKLNDRGCNVKSVYELNKHLENMGIQENVGGMWKATEEGSKYVLDSYAYNYQALHENVVDEVYDYLKNK